VRRSYPGCARPGEGEHLTHIRGQIDISALALAVERDGAAVVSGVAVESDDALLDVVSAVGAPSGQGNGGGVIYDVTPQAEGTDFSRTAQRFPLHTDSTFLPEPHAYIALACVEAPAAGGGGESCMVSADVLRDELTQRCGEDVVQALSEPAFPFVIQEPGGERALHLLAILETGADGPPRVRYRLDAIVRALQEHELVLGPRHAAALEALEEVLGDPDLQVRFALRPGDVLIVDNHRMLHGRSEIDEGAQRLLRRIKLDRR
jgi:hypothetical protein